MRATNVVRYSDATKTFTGEPVAEAPGGPPARGYFRVCARTADLECRRPARAARARAALARLTVGAAALAALASRAIAAEPITLSVDAGEVQRKILHAREVIPAKPGPLTLEYPKWIRGEHGPNGPVVNLAGLKVSAGGTPVTWRRDDVDMYAFHLDVPRGAASIEADLDYLMPVREGLYTEGISSTAELAMLNWYDVLLYPRGTPSDDVTFAARLRLPAGWKFGTALPVAGGSSEWIEFSPASLTTLADSPVLCGEYFRAVPLGVFNGASHEIDIAADSAAALEIEPRMIERYRVLVLEYHALFGAHHYRSYHWLLALTDAFHRSGVEHHESSDDRYPEEGVTNEKYLKLLPGLLAHEYAHSWNGKYRRPLGLSGPSFEEPMKGELLWVYEGLTTYIGTIMPARAGLATPEDLREQLAETAAAMSHQAGRAWRPLEDTAVAAQTLYGSGDEWHSWRRGTDFYPESQLIWLEADGVIRRLSDGKRSLDDFCRRFFGGSNTAPRLETYTLDDVLKALNEVAPFDWRGFFEKRVVALAPEAPLGGIEASGWKLVYGEAPNAHQALEEAAWKTTDETCSIGVRLRRDGTIADVVPGMAGTAAGLAPGMTIVAVNGRKYSAERLRRAIAGSKAPSSRLELLVVNDEIYRTAVLDYHDGARYPHLVRDSSRPDLLSEVLRPRAAAAGARH